MARPRNGQPYLKGGVYHVRFKGDAMSTDLGTKSIGLAKARLNEVVRMRTSRGVATVSSSVSTNVAPKPSPNLAGIGNGAPNSLPPSESTGALDDWYRADSEFTRTESVGGPPSGPSNAGVSTSVPMHPSAGANLQSGSVQGSQSASLTKIDWEASPGTASLSSDEKMRLHGLLASVVGRLNVLGVGLGVRIFGRIPAEPESADMELLNKAWALQLNEMFADKEIKPAILIAAASVGLGVGMYVNGEPKPKPPKDPVNV